MVTSSTRVHIISVSLTACDECLARRAGFRHSAAADDAPRAKAKVKVIVGVGVGVRVQGEQRTADSGQNGNSSRSGSSSRTYYSNLRGVLSHR